MDQKQKFSFIPAEFFKTKVAAPWPEGYSKLPAHLSHKNGSSDLPKVVVGPVIGMVTETTARILLEISKDSEVSITLEALDIDTRPFTEPLIHSMKGGRPTIFEFDNLIPGTHYRLHCNVFSGVVFSGFRTIRPDFRIRQENARIAIVSRNSSIFMAEERTSCRVTTDRSFNPDTWKTLYQLATRGSIDLILHAGGSVILNDDTAGPNLSPIKAALQIATKPFLTDSDKAVTICEIFRDVYRQSWSFPFVRHAMANCPNLIARSGDDIGLGKCGTPIDTSTSEGQLVLRCAHYVSCEYERQLFETTYLPSTSVPKFWRDSEADDELLSSLTEDPSEDESESSHGSIFLNYRGLHEVYLNVRESLLSHKIINMGDIGIICIDDLSPVYLSDLTLGGMSRQLDHLKAALSPSYGPLSACRLLLVVTPQPLIGESFTNENLTGRTLNNFRNHLRKVILNYGRQWTNTEPITRRKMCLITGGSYGSSFEEITSPNKQQGLLPSLFKSENPSLPPIYQLSVPPMSLGVSPRPWSTKLTNLISSVEKGKPNCVRNIGYVDGRGFFVFTVFGSYEDTSLSPAVQYYRDVDMATNFSVGVLPAGCIKNISVFESQNGVLDHS